MDSCSLLRPGAIVTNPRVNPLAERKTVTEETVVISARGLERLRSGHLWVYRSDISRAQAEPGAVVRLRDERDRFCGRAFYSDKSQIAIRLLTREDVPVDRAFFLGRFRNAAEYRRRVVSDTDAFRVVYGEADLLPSVIVDRYGDYLVLQTLSQGAEGVHASSVGVGGITVSVAAFASCVEQAISGAGNFRMRELPKNPVAEALDVRPTSAQPGVAGLSGKNFGEIGR